MKHERVDVYGRGRAIGAGLLSLWASACSGRSLAAEDALLTELAQLPEGQMLLIQQEYPIPGEDDNLSICSQHKYLGDDGLVYTVNETYDFEGLNREIANEPQFAEYLRQQGQLESVASCATARRFDKLRYSYVEGARPPPGGTAPDEESTKPELQVPSKTLSIADSITYAHSPTVHVRIWSGSGFNDLDSCSGFLFAPKALLTAAHCIPLTKRRPITIQAFDGTCVYPPGHTNCTAKPTQYAQGYRHESYAGSGASNDIGLIKLDELPEDPLNEEYARILLAGEPTNIGHQVWVLGFGFNTSGGGGFGVQRLTNTDPNVDMVYTDYHVFDTQPLEGRACHGDSGGPNVSTEAIPNPGYNVAVALYSNTTKEPDWQGKCPEYYRESRHTLIAPKLEWIMDKVGTCTPAIATNGYDYVKCW